MLLVLCIATAHGAQNKRLPHIGYLYPSGGRQGTVIRIIAGGQFLRGAADVYISGEGVNASVVKYYAPNTFYRREQRQLLQKRIEEVRNQRLKEIGINPRTIPGAKKAKKKKIVRPKKKDDSEKKTTEKEVVVKMSDHPLLFDMDNNSLRELAHLRDTIFFPRRMTQPNRQLAESVLIEITIDPHAKPGNREIRIQTPLGLTNPMVFQVATLPEVRELEPNNDQAYPKYFNIPGLPKAKPLKLPVVLNGQIMPGDVDRFRFTAQKGQKLVIEAHARSLIPYLSDAVPGWFQATLTLYDGKGNEVAFVDDYRFNPDPVLFYEIPKTGEYELEIRDSIYRGREDFVYRIAVSDQPFVTRIFPLGGKAYSIAKVAIDGWNLPETKLTLDTGPGSNNIRQMTYNSDKTVSSPITYAVDTLAETTETESNNTIKDAQAITLPIIINGRIDRPGDVDVFSFKGRQGKKVVAEVYGRRLNSPVDSLLRLTDANGTTLSFNDDYIKKDGHLHKDIVGLTTHHADSYIMADLPQDGPYYVHLSDSQYQGGAAFAYRLRVVEPHGDFTLRVTPSSLHTYAGGIVDMRVHVLRKDGFDGEIIVTLKNAPTGFKIGGGTIPAGCDLARITLATPTDAPAKPVSLELQGTAWIAARMVTHTAIPAEDMTQAFLYRHLVPSQQLLIAFHKNRPRAPSFESIGDGPVHTTTGTSAAIRFKIAKHKLFHNIELQLDQPPKGLTLHDVKVDAGILSFELRADKDLRSTGFTGNIIVEAFRVPNPKNKRRVSIGVLPAIPIEMVKQ